MEIQVYAAIVKAKKTWEFLITYGTYGHQFLIECGQYEIPSIRFV